MVYLNEKMKKSFQSIEMLWINKNSDNVILRKFFIPK